MTAIATATVTITDGPAAGVTYLVDNLGFPCATCPRCLGRGELFAYHHNHGGVCFACKGTGTAYPKGKAGTIAEAARAARRPTPLDSSRATVGMTIRIARRHAEPDPWRTIATRTIEPTPWPGGDLVDVHVITFTDGSSERLTGVSLESRPDIERLDAELADRVAEARTAHERLLARRAARAR